MKCIMVRHAETKANADKKIYGWTESEYSMLGEKQVEKLVEYLVLQNIDKIYASPLRRALTIAERVGKEKGIHIIKDDRLKEMNFGILEDMTYKEAKAKYKDHYDSFMKDFENYVIPNGESFAQVHIRAKAFIDSIEETDECLLMVAHGGVVRSLMLHLLDLNFKDTWHFEVPPATIIEIDYDKGFGKLKQFIPIGDQVKL
ncbi:MAG: histidine phosphatase family protein [Clostridia bacterium]|nr:histidine phosphatase family protein [Clostridia bacterium]